MIHTHKHTPYMIQTNTHTDTHKHPTYTHTQTHTHTHTLLEEGEGLVTSAYDGFVSLLVARSNDGAETQPPST